jgi:serine/threonine-protein kinase
MIGAVLGDRYLMQARLSRGGMGVVYKARHKLLETAVAVKILLEQS